MTNGFFMVLNTATDRTVYRHNIRNDAETEAERLARLHTGQEFIVLAAVCSRKVDGMQRQNFTYDDIPF